MASLNNKETSVLCISTKCFQIKTIWLAAHIITSPPPLSGHCQCCWLPTIPNQLDEVVVWYGRFRWWALPYVWGSSLRLTH